MSTDNDPETQRLEKALTLLDSNLEQRKNAYENARDLFFHAYQVRFDAWQHIGRWKADGPGPWKHVMQYCPTAMGQYKCRRCGSEGLSEDVGLGDCKQLRGVWL